MHLELLVERVLDGATGEAAPVMIRADLLRSLLHEWRSMRDELRMRADLGELARVRQAFGVTDVQGRLLLAIYHGAAHTISRRAWEETRLWSDARDMATKLPDVHIHNLRAKLGGMRTIEAVRNHGWRLPQETAERVRQALSA